LSPSSFLFTPKGDRVLCGSLTGHILRYEVATGNAVEFYRPDNSCTVKAIAVSPDGGSAAWAADTHLYFARLWPFELIAHHKLGKTHFLSVAFHPSGRFFASVNGDGKVDFWDAITGQHKQAFDWGIGKLHDVAFDADGHRAACCGKSGEIIVWDVDE